MDNEKAKRVLDIANELAIVNMDKRVVETSYRNVRSDIDFYIETGIEEETIKLMKDMSYRYQNQLLELKAKQHKLTMSVLRRINDVIEEDIKFE